MNRRRPTWPAVLLLAVAVGGVIWLVRPDAYRREFGIAPPEGTKVVQSAFRLSGFDRCDGIMLTAPDGAAIEQVARMWQLERIPDQVDSGVPVCFLDFDPPEWWPDEESRAAMERYGREVGNRYWSAWHDRSEGEVYLEWGDW